MVVEKILGNIKNHPSEKKTVTVALEWFESGKRRILKTAEDGSELGICISDEIKPGDILAETEKCLYIADILPCRLIKIPVTTMEEMGQLCFELGNRHLPLKITETEVFTVFDPPTFSCLKKKGFPAEEITGVFTDFLECKMDHHHG